MKNKLSEFICDVVSKTGDYATTLLDKFKTNLIAIFGFLLTVILANIVSDQPLNNIFTYDISVILESVLVGSALYLIICIIETRYQFKKAKNSYYALKKNYKPLLSDIDIQEIFNNDNLMKTTSKSVNRGLLVYSIIWAIFIIGAFITVENVSSNPPIITLFQTIASM